MRNEDDSHLEVAHDPEHILVNRDPRRLVQQEDGRQRRDGRQEHDPASHPSRHLIWVRVGELLEADEPEQLADPSLRLGCWRAMVPVVETDVLGCGQPGEEGVFPESRDISCYPVLVVGDEVRVKG